MKGAIAVVALSVVIGLITGCASTRLYPGPPRSPGELAVLVTNPSSPLIIDSLDALSTSRSDRYEVLPGKHSVNVRPIEDGAVLANAATTPIFFVAVAGHVYRLRVTEGGEKKWSVRIDDGGMIPASRDATSAAELQSSCLGGEAASCLRLGRLYEQGGSEMGWDEARAALLYGRACENGQAQGCTHLAGLYESGHGLEKDEQRATTLYDEACTAGDPPACYNLGRRYQEGRGEAKDERRAAELYEKACHADDAAACFDLGALYREGLGVSADEHRAATLYEKACAGGEPKGCVGLGLLYEDGLGVEQDERRAAVFYEKACLAGAAMGCANLGVLYDLGIGVTRNERRARAMFKKGCEGGAESACTSLANLKPETPGTSEDESPATDSKARAAPSVARTQAPASAPMPARPAPSTPVTVAAVESPRSGAARVEERVGSGTQPQGAASSPPSAPAPTPSAPTVSAAGGDSTASTSSQPATLGVQLGLRGELDVLRPVLVAALTAELSRGAWAGALTVIVQAPPALRLEGRWYPFQWGPARPYAALGGSLFFPAVAGRAALGVDVLLAPIHLFGDVAYEHFFNPEATYAADSVLVSLGVAWQLPL